MCWQVLLWLSACRTKQCLPGHAASASSPSCAIAFPAGLEALLASLAQVQALGIDELPDADKAKKLPQVWRLRISFVGVEPKPRVTNT